MRWFTVIALGGTAFFIGHLGAQSLAEHAAAAAGATVGSAAGKSVSGAITNIFGKVDDQTNAASKTGAKPGAKPAAKPAAADKSVVGKPSPAGPPVAAPRGGNLPPEAPLTASAGSGSAGTASAGTASAGSPRIAKAAKPTRALTPASTAQRRVPASSPQHASSPIERPLSPLEASLAPVVPPAVIAPPAPRVPTAEEISAIKLGASEKEVFVALGLPASHVIVPDDDGHLRESCQYWANGSQLGTIRLDNGYVVKVEVRPN